MRSEHLTLEAKQQCQREWLSRARWGTLSTTTIVLVSRHTWGHKWIRNANTSQNAMFVYHGIIKCRSIPAASGACCSLSLPQGWEYNLVHPKHDCQAWFKQMTDQITLSTISSRTLLFCYQSDRWQDPPPHYMLQKPYPYSSMPHGNCKANGSHSANPLITWYFPFESGNDTTIWLEALWLPWISGALL